MIKWTIVFLFFCISTTIVAQYELAPSPKEFKGMANTFEKDAEIFEMYKKAVRKKKTANGLGFISIISIVTGSAVILTHESTGQSSDIAVIIPVLGLLTFGSVTGVSALFISTAAKKKREETISLYHEKYGIGITLNSLSSKSHELRVNLNDHGIGIILSF